MKNLYPLFFGFLLLLIVWQLGFFRVLELRPQAIHQWAQIDRASVARNYAEESMNFFKPRVHETKQTTGITGMEFPLLNYTAAIMYRLFGFNEYYYRLQNMLLALTLMFFVFYLARELLRNYFEATLVSVIFFLSPIANYYTPNFMPDVVSLLAVMAGWYGLFRFRKTGKKKYLLLMGIFLSLGALLKITSLISSIVILVIILMDLIRKRIYPRSVPWLIKRWKLLVVVIAVMAITFSWYWYAAWLSKEHSATYFLLEIRPVQSFEHFLVIWNDIKVLWLPFYYSPLLYFLLAAGSIFIVFRYKYVKSLFLFITLGLYAGAILFVLLMWSHIQHHDYYMVPLLAAIFFHLVLIADTIKKQPSSYPIMAFYIILIILPFQMLSYSKKYQQQRYTGWMNQSELTFLPQYDGLEQYLRSLGIKRDDKTVSIYDYSPNITLYLMDQKGWSIYQWHDDERLNYALNDSKWAVINDSAALEVPVIRQYLQQQIGYYNGVMIYKLNP